MPIIGENSDNEASVKPNSVVGTHLQRSEHLININDSHATQHEAFEMALAGDFDAALELLGGCEGENPQAY